MTALAANRDTPAKGTEPIAALYEIGVLATQVIYTGALVCVQASSGYAVVGSATTGLVAVGRAEATANNLSGASAAINVKVRTGIFRWANSADSDAIAADDIGKVCYIVDDQTVALTSNSGARSPAGRVVEVDSSGVWVEMRPTLGMLASDLALLDSAGLFTGADQESVNAEIVKKANAALANPITVPVILSGAVSDAVVWRFVPGYAGKIRAMNAMVMHAVTTGSKSAVFTAAISAISLSGGVVSTTSANLATLGAVVSGTAVGGLNAFTASQSITVVAAPVTAYAEGEVLLQIFLDPAA